MSLPPLSSRRTCQSFPRVSGDEPEVYGQDNVTGEFSPRERG